MLARATSEIERAETLKLYGSTLMREEPTRYEGEELFLEGCRLLDSLPRSRALGRFMVLPEVQEEI